MIDKVPRELRADQKQALRILARHVVSQLELRRRSRELAEAGQKGEKMERKLAKLRAELAQARRQLAAHNGKRRFTAESGSRKARK